MKLAETRITLVILTKMCLCVYPGMSSVCNKHFLISIPTDGKLEIVDLCMFAAETELAHSIYPI